LCARYLYYDGHEWKVGDTPGSQLQYAASAPTDAALPTAAPWEDVEIFAVDLAADVNAYEFVDGAFPPSDASLGDELARKNPNAVWRPVEHVLRTKSGLAPHLFDGVEPSDVMQVLPHAATPPRRPRPLRPPAQPLPNRLRDARCN
jgi:hypothetical protein